MPCVFARREDFALRSDDQRWIPRFRARVCHLKVLRVLVLFGRVRVLRTRSRGRPLRRVGVVAVINIEED
jgi:hypothetical protein